MTDYKQLCAELLLFSEEAGEICTCEGLWPVKCDPNYTLLNRARAALAEPEPEPPADGEVADLVLFLKDNAEDALADECPIVAGQFTRAADLLERLASPACLVVNPPPEAVQALKAAGPGRIELMPADPPQPVPVSERLPGPGDWVWHCYAGSRFWQHGIYNGRQFFVGDGPESQPATHWLPAHALPLPQLH